MFQRVDIDKNAKGFEGFSYLNKNGGAEMVKIEEGQIFVSVCIDGMEGTIYTDDIPKMIKALEAAYKHKKGL